MIKAVIFDMDGLMFDTERLWDTLWEPTCRALGLEMPQDLEAFFTGGRGLAGVKLNEHIQKFFPQADPQVIVEKIWELAEQRFAQGVPCKPGLAELLETLEEKKLPRIVASSSPRALIQKNLETTGMARYFDQVVCGADVRHSKPAPDIFLEAARRLGVDIRDCLVLEDSFNGVRAGHAAGAVTVMVPDIAQPDEEIRALYNRCCKDLFEVRQLLLDGQL
ncbi:HAD family hydrolase [Allofournierella massiliensis]|uniref:HAD family phosphatase n=1 Tax=Allofournierella massiliensis TaxID=1650663 RepID=A0ABT7URP9_9FIRM|nr:HAD family phosphatase [Fournierella massiliensis]MDM8201561.1 HAD family phosphatase [Fournierella massiliensis]